MITRKEFVKSLALVAVSPALAPVLLSSCAPAGLSVKVPEEDGWVTLPVSSLPPVDDPYGFTRVYVNGRPNPVYLFRSGGDRITAVSSTCSHNGCSVKKLRDRFECPCHGSEYSLEGHVSKGPAPDPLMVYPVTVSGDVVRFRVEELI